MLFFLFQDINSHLKHCVPQKQQTLTKNFVKISLSSFKNLISLKCQNFSKTNTGPNAPSNPNFYSRIRGIFCAPFRSNLLWDCPGHVCPNI